MTPARIFCIGRNYVTHARELGNEIPATPVLFMKPASALLEAGAPIVIPPDRGALHYEAELVILVGRSGRVAREADADAFVGGLGLGLDLTLRDLQARLKQAGLPWELSKAFDGSATVTPCVRYAPEAMDLTDLTYTCHVNGELRQQGHTAHLIFPVRRLLLEISLSWALIPGDLIYTGTPAGVGPLAPGDTIAVASDLIGAAAWQVEGA